MEKHGIEDQAMRFGCWAAAHVDSFFLGLSAQALSHHCLQSAARKAVELAEEEERKVLRYVAQITGNLMKRVEYEHTMLLLAHALLLLMQRLHRMLTASLFLCWSPLFVE